MSGESYRNHGGLILEMTKPRKSGPSRFQCTFRTNEPFIIFQMLLAILFGNLWSQRSKKYFRGPLDSSRRAWLVNNRTYRNRIWSSLSHRQEVRRTGKVSKKNWLRSVIVIVSEKIFFVVFINIISTIFHYLNYYWRVNFGLPIDINYTFTFSSLARLTNWIFIANQIVDWL